VLCVTHLPQVASQANQHYQVKKRSEDGKTLSASTAWTPRRAWKKSPACWAGWKSPPRASMRASCWRPDPHSRQEPGYPMAFRKEPPHTHGSMASTAVVLVNLGTPDAPDARSLRRYLKQFLSDPRVVEIPRLLWWCILNGIILPFRSGKSAEKYASIWTEQGSPLRVHTARQAVALGTQPAARGHHQLRVEYAMRYGTPSVNQVLDR
jgi:hypothetical protein